MIGTVTTMDTLFAQRDLTARIRRRGGHYPMAVKADQAEVDGKVQAVREILEKDRENIDRLRPAHEELVQALTRVGTSMYEAAGAAGATDGADGGEFGANGAGADGAGATAADDATVEGEFREVGSDR